MTKDGQSLPSARLVSTELTSANDRPSSSINTILLMALGQFIDHDLDHVPVFSKFTNFFSSVVGYNGAQTVYYSILLKRIHFTRVDPKYCINRKVIIFVASSPSQGDIFFFEI